MNVNTIILFSPVSLMRGIQTNTTSWRFQDFIYADFEQWTKFMLYFIL